MTAEEIAALEQAVKDDWSDARKAFQAAKNRGNVFVPGFHSQRDYAHLMRERNHLIGRYKQSQEKMKATKDQLTELDFEIDCKLDHDLKPLGLDLLQCDKNKLNTFGKDLDILTRFRTDEQREQAVKAAKKMVHMKAQSLKYKIDLVDKYCQESQNYKGIAMLNTMLGVSDKYVTQMIEVAQRNPGPFPPADPQSIPGMPEPVAWGRGGKDAFMQRKVLKDNRRRQQLWPRPVDLPETHENIQVGVVALPSTQDCEKMNQAFTEQQALKKGEGQGDKSGEQQMGDKGEKQ